MASYVKYENFVEDLGLGVHDFSSSGHTLKVMLTLSAPDAASDAVKADISEISAGNGYAAGGEDAQNEYTRSGGTATLSCQDVVWTASGGAIADFRYVHLYNDTPTSPTDPLISYWDYGATVTMNVGETFTVDFGASTFTIT